MGDKKKELGKAGKRRGVRERKYGEMIGAMFFWRGEAEFYVERIYDRKRFTKRDIIRCES